MPRYISTGAFLRLHILCAFISLLDSSARLYLHALYVRRFLAASSSPDSYNPGSKGYEPRA